MYINAHSLHLTCEEIFQILHDQDLRLWEQVLDLLSNTAEELYTLTPVVGGKRRDSVIENGIQFDQAGVFWSNEDCLYPAKWEKIVGHK